MKRNPITLVTGAVLLLLFALMLFTFQVRQTEVAVVTFFGKYSRSITKPGFQLRFPWPIEKVHQFDRRLRTFETKFDQSPTRDQIMMTTAIYVGWRIADDARIFLERFNGDVAAVERVLGQVVINAKSEVLGRHDFSDLVSTNAAQMQFDLVESNILERVRGRAQGDYGIEIGLLGIKRLGLPESVTTTVFERMRAERQRLAAHYQAEGEREAKIIRARADGEANAIVAAARATAARIEGDAEVEAQQHYRVFEQNPGLAIFLLQLRAIEQSLKERTHIILDNTVVPFNLMSSPAEPAPAQGSGEQP